MRPYQIPPTFPNKKMYAECLGLLVDLEFYVESLKEK
jgi:hypothetical protein